MLTSRGLILLRSLRQVSKINHANNLQQLRNSHGGVYRLPAAPAPRSVIIVSELLGGFGWWWILWHIWHDFDHIIGEFEYPDASKWTDAELGIPPDDEDV